MTLTFKSWSDYHDWLKDNCDKFAVYAIDETKDGITITYCSTEDWKKKHENKSEK